MGVINSLRIGSLAAESDDALFDYFVVTPIAERIMTGRVGVVLGRKGSGKTALFRQMEELLATFGKAHVKVIRLNMDDYSWAAFQKFTALGLSREHAATVAWQLAIQLQVAVHLAQFSGEWTREARTDVEILTRFVSDNFGEALPNLAKVGRLFGQLSTLKVAAFGAGVEAAFRGSGESDADLVPALTDALAQHLKRPLEESAWMVILDQLDESWDGSQDKRDLLVGLEKGVKRFNDDFGWRSQPVVGAVAVAFLRTDIHESLSFDDKDKHRDVLAEIRWDHESLKEMLASRFGSVSVDEIFDSVTTQRKGRIPKGSLNYLISRTFMRPRDLLQFLLKIQADAGDADKITKPIVEAAEPHYSRDKVDDVRQEYRRGAPWVDPVLDALRQGPNKYDSRAVLEERLRNRIPDDRLNALEISIVDLVEWMTDASILGSAARAVKSETIQFRCEGKAVSLEGDSTAWVHPALFSGLSLFEPRVAAS